MNVFFTHLGCKLNQAELESLMRQFEAAGHRVVGSLADADLHVVNSCTVTQQAERDSRKAARRGGREHPGLRTVLTGCYASVAPGEAAALAGVDLVVPNVRKPALLEEVHAAFPHAVPAAPPLLGAAGPAPVAWVPMELGRVRAAVKVEDGCDMSCAFCIVPLSRGRQRSRPIAEVVAEVESLVASGHQEIVVTGVQISAYRDRTARLHDLVRALLEHTAAPRLRLTSIAPWQLDDRLLELWPEPRLCRHFHLSLQSGCDATLRRMRRPYTSAAFATLLEKLRQRIPGVAVTTDVIAGFPGETDQESRDSAGFVERSGFARVHVFTYSARPGTLAAGLPDQVEPARRRERTAALLEIARTSQHRFLNTQLGQWLPVLWEREVAGRWRGMTDNYVRVWSYERPSGALGGARLVCRLSEDTDGSAWAVPA